MKQIKETKIISQEVILYEALDGTQFEDKSECLKYEKTADGIISYNYRKLVLKTTDEQEAFNGNADYIIDVVKVSSKKDVDTILKKLVIANSFSNLEALEEVYIKMVEDALSKKDYLIIKHTDDYTWMFPIGIKSVILYNAQKAFTV